MENDEYLGLSELEIQQQFLDWNPETQKWERKAKLEGTSPLPPEIVEQLTVNENGETVITNNGHEIHPTSESEKYKEQKKEVNFSMLADFLANIDFTLIQKPSYVEGEDLNEEDKQTFDDLKVKYRKMVTDATFDSSPFDLLLMAHPEMTSEELDQKFSAIPGFEFEPEPEDEPKPEDESKGE
jgi:hypothetical protein